MVIALTCLYGFFLLIAICNAFGLRRPPRTCDEPFEAAVCIPARNEEENLARLVPILVQQGARVYVFDDESTDQTASTAAKAGAIVIRASEPLPSGWTGKNRACHELAKVVAEDFRGEFMVFLDADTYPAKDFLNRLGAIVRAGRAPVTTGFPHMLPGSGLEPVYLGWVPWILASSNPFFIVRLTGTGHGRFTNGQIQVWKTSTYFEVMPHETLKDAVLEDVLIGRLLAKQGIRVEVANLSSILGVKMYANLREAVDGMSKNTCFITGSDIGTALLGLFFFGLSLAWLFAGSIAWLPYSLLVISKLAVDRVGRSPLWTAPLMPLTLLMAGYTCFRSLSWKRSGLIQWKGRTYS